MKSATYFLGLKTIIFLLLASLASCNPRPNSLEPQEYDADILVGGPANESQKILENYVGNWWVICAIDGENFLLPAHVKLEGEDQKKKLVQIDKCDKVLFYVRNLEGLSEGKITTGEIHDKNQKRRLVSTTFNQEQFRLYEIQDLGPKDHAGYQIKLSHLRQKQTIYATNFTDDRPANSWLVTWVGDLDRDERPDFLLYTSHKYSSYQMRLFVSSQATKGNLVKEVAMTYSSGT